MAHLDGDDGPGFLRGEHLRKALEDVVAAREAHVVPAFVHDGEGGEVVLHHNFGGLEHVRVGRDADGAPCQNRGHVGVGAEQVSLKILQLEALDPRQLLARLDNPLSRQVLAETEALQVREVEATDRFGNVYRAAPTPGRRPSSVKRA